MEVIILIGTLLIAFLIFTWLAKVVRATISAVITVALVVVVFQIFFGVSPMAFFNALGDVWESIVR